MMIRDAFPLPPTDPYDDLGVGPEATDAEIAEARLYVANRLRSRLALIRRTLAAEPADTESDRSRALRARLDELETRLLALNRSPLATTIGRAAYDAEHPPLELLKLAELEPLDQGLGRFERERLERDLREFLAGLGEPSPPGSDAERDDCLVDFTPDPFLDGGSL